MSLSSFRHVCRRGSNALWLLAWGMAALPLRADQVQMVNGDLYAGHLVSMDATTLVMQSDVLGTLKIPRAKVDFIRLSPAAGVAASAPVKPTMKSTNAPALLPVPGGATNSATADQLLEGASPEARAKFNSMVSGLLTGKMSTSDIRAEAKSIAEQVRAMRADLGEEAGGMLDSYLAILDRFVAEEEPKTEKPAPSSRPKP